MGTFENEKHKPSEEEKKENSEKERKMDDTAILTNDFGA